MEPDEVHREQCSGSWGQPVLKVELSCVLFQNLKEKGQLLTRGGHKAKELLSW